MDDVIIDTARARSFVQELLVRNGADRAEAGTVTDALIWCNLRGLPGQGLCRVPTLIKRLAAGGIASPCNAEFRRLGRTAASLDGHGGFGQVLGVRAVRHAVDLAAEQGMSIVTVRNSNHFGAAGYYAHLAAEQGMIALVMSNAYPSVAAYGGVKAVVGTNPLALGAPRRGRDNFIVDMGTTFRSMTATAERLDQTGRIEDGVAIDRHGKPVSDAKELRAGAMLPPSPRDFALGVVVEILSGVLTNAEYSGGLRSFYRHPDMPGGLGHLFICLQIERFLPQDEFLTRLERLIGMLTSSGDMNPDSPVRMPGERRWAMQRENEARGAFPVRKQTMSALAELAGAAGVSPPWP